MHEKEVSEDDENKTHKYWKVIMIGIGFAIIAGVIIMLVKVLGNNPFVKALDDLAGDAAILAKDFITGCCKQVDCKNITDSSTCGESCGCLWSAGTSPSPSPPSPSPPTPPPAGPPGPAPGPAPAACLNNSGVDPGDGGFFSFKCPLFITAFIGLLAFFLFKIVGGLFSLFRSRRDAAIDDLSQLSQKPDNEIIDEFREHAEGVHDRVRDSPESDKWTEGQVEYSAKRCVYESYKVTVVDKLKTFDENIYKEASERLEKKISSASEGMNSGETDDVDKVVEDNVDPGEGG